MTQKMYKFAFYYYNNYSGICVVKYVFKSNI